MFSSTRCVAPLWRIGSRAVVVFNWLNRGNSSSSICHTKDNCEARVGLSVNGTGMKNGGGSSMVFDRWLSARIPARALLQADWVAR
jgi:hypothetical protein